MPECIAWREVPDPSLALRPIVEGLARGERVVVPTEVGYVVVGPLNPTDDPERAEPGGEEARGGVLVRDDADALGRVPSLPPEAQRLARRCWPGPLWIRWEGEAPPPELGSGPGCPEGRGGIRFWCPASEPARELLRSYPGTVGWLGPPGLRNPEDSLREGWGPVRWVIDAGPLPATDPPTEIRVGPGGWRVERAGAFPEEELRRRAALQIVFVCTGNTCRSPLAEALCKAALARRLGCPPEELPARGFDILSAGVAAYEGCPASPEAVAVAAELGADLRSHRSRAVSPELLVGADLLVAVGRSHREILRAVLGAEGGKVRLLCEDADVPDPIGGDREVYRACARTIADQVERLVSEWHSQ